MTIIIPGLRVASKKNNRRNFRGISLPSLAYVKFHSLVMPYMFPYRKQKFTQPIKMTIDYQIKGKYHQDIDNAVSSVFDCLTDYKIIEDDDLITEVIARKSGGHKDWNLTITIEPI